jgi:hypothetical protein
MTPYTAPTENRCADLHCADTDKETHGGDQTWWPITLTQWWLGRASVDQ